MTTITDSEKPVVVKGKTWPGTRPPVNNPMLEDLKMDASWGRGKFRDEIWEDQLSPLNEWWRAYEPSDEEYEAIALGYDFTNPRQWFEERGINYDDALAETTRLNQEAYKKYQETRAEMMKLLKESPQKFDEIAKKRAAIIAAHNHSDDIEDYSDEEVKLLEYYYELKCLKQEVEYRKIDDERQKSKGEISLDLEDSGVRFHNK